MATQAETLEQKFVEVKHNTSMKIEEFKKLEASFSELAVKDCLMNLKANLHNFQFRHKIIKIRQENIIKESQLKIEKYYNDTNLSHRKCNENIQVKTRL